jgi:hypothetical protein
VWNDFVAPPKLPKMSATCGEPSMRVVLSWTYGSCVRGMNAQSSVPRAEHGVAGVADAHTACSMPSVAPK